LERAPLSIRGNCTIGQCQGPALSLEDLGVDVPQKEFSGLLWIGDIAGTVQEIPGDLKRTLYKDW
jgi:hypothetical protein